MYKVGFTFSLALGAVAASLPPTPEGLTTLNSTQYPGVALSFKETHICETTAGTKAYSGYIHLPPSADEGRAYPINTFFWFFEARNKPENAPLSVWLQGGPGVPSIPAALGENGPCNVNIDSKSTSLNPWSWNQNVNMLYIDQPVQVGFSYDVLANGIINELVSPFAVTPDNSTTNMTTLAGTFSSQKLSSAPNTTDTAAVAFWHFVQTFTQEFPKYKPSSNKFSVWSESYGGHYAPTFAAYFQKQNKLIASGALKAPSVQMELDTVGLINACIDMNTQVPLYPDFAYNNTYGIQAINASQYEAAVSKIPECKNLTDTCRSMTEKLDPQGVGNNPDVTKACATAYGFCFKELWKPFGASGRYQFDITSPILTSFPPKLAAGYLNEADIQQALGVPLNFTGNSVPIAEGFLNSGDFVKGHGLENLGQLLDDGVKIALVYGDKDYQCNWLGGEQISLAIKSQSSSSFQKAGYANLETNSSYVGGLVRQYGNLSFSRVFEAGHEVPYYQPETAFEIFNRVMFNKDVATGKSSTNSPSEYSTSGPAEIFSVKNKVTQPPGRYCYLWDMLETCSPAEKMVVASGHAIVQDFILLGYTAPNGTEIYYPNAAELRGEIANSTSATGPKTTSVVSGASKNDAFMLMLIALGGMMVHMVL